LLLPFVRICLHRYQSTSPWGIIGWRGLLVFALYPAKTSNLFWNISEDDERRRQRIIVVVASTLAAWRRCLGRCSHSAESPVGNARGLFPRRLSSRWNSRQKRPTSRLSTNRSARKQERTDANEVHPVALLIACWKIKRGVRQSANYSYRGSVDRVVIHVAMNFIAKSKWTVKLFVANNNQRVNDVKHDIVLFYFDKRVDVLLTLWEWKMISGSHGLEWARQEILVNLLRTVMTR
jgi:hypothetical protein